MTTSRPSIALALSGGGIRAMVFHLGVIKHLAKRGWFDDVARFSTVSGGSLLVGLLLQQSQMHWPTSEQFLARSLPALRESLCMRGLQWGAVRQLLSPLNWRFLLSRANLLARALQREWQVQAALAGIPVMPEGSINGTTEENGKRFRFKRHDIGDYTLGYASAERVSLASALAVSAAFPGGFGPLTLDTRRFDWRRRSWDEPPEAAKPVEATFWWLHLYDGGVYGNVGLEPFFDARRQRPKHDCGFIICSDAGAPLVNGFRHGPLSVFRLKRVADIMSDQSGSLRVRAFAHYLQQTPSGGAYLYINTPISASENCPSVQFAASFPTTLRRLNIEEFDRLAAHGQTVAKQALVTGACWRVGNLWAHQPARFASTRWHGRSKLPLCTRQRANGARLRIIHRWRSSAPSCTAVRIGLRPKDEPFTSALVSSAKAGPRFLKRRTPRSKKTTDATRWSTTTRMGHRSVSLLRIYG